MCTHTEQFRSHCTFQGQHFIHSFTQQFTEGLPPGWVDAKMHGEVAKLKVIVTPWKKHLDMSLDLQSPPQR